MDRQGSGMRPGILGGPLPAWAYGSAMTALPLSACTALDASVATRECGFILGLLLLAACWPALHQSQSTDPQARSSLFVAYAALAGWNFEFGLLLTAFRTGTPPLAFVSARFAGAAVVGIERMRRRSSLPFELPSDRSL